VVPYFEERADGRAALFERGLSIQPKLVSFALGDPGDLVERAHEAGALVMLQVTTVDQAEQAAARGVDVMVAQGGESGGYGGTVATMVLVPQVVDAVRPIPVVAAGSIFDGRGLAQLWCSARSA
jgi:nitronate monooxygenase/enoyl-[acyl-carrier protein] reductase II